MINLRPEYAARAIQGYFADSNGENHRYRSWEHCYLAFKKAKEQKSQGKTIDLDLLSLHLSEYLSSWGMRRNSFLLDRDYRTHIGIVELLLDNDYNMLWTFPGQNPADRNANTLGEYWENIAGIRDVFIQVYNPDIHDNGLANEDQVSVTDTLVTKILLGTCGCVPANDRLYQTGMRVFNGIQSFGKKSYSHIMRYYWLHEETINEHLDGFPLVTHDDSTVPYPPMKLMDMCFWQIGYFVELHDKRPDLEQRFSNLIEEEKYMILDEYLPMAGD